MSSWSAAFSRRFRKIAKNDYSFVMSARPHGTTRLPLDRFSWNLIFENFSKICRENSLKSDKNKGYFTWRPIYIFIISRHFTLKWEMFQTEVVEKIRTHFVFINPFFFENCAFCEKMWKNIVERGRPQMTIWRMRISCWIPKATNPHRLCNTRCFSTSTMVALTRLNVTLYVLACLVCLADLL